MTWPVTCNICFYRYIFPYTLGSPRYSGFFLFSSNSIFYLQWHTWLSYLYSWLHTLHTLLKLFRLIYFYSSSYSFAAPILWVRECPTMFSHAQTSRSQKSKNPKGMMKTQAGWPSHLVIYQNLCLWKHFLPQLGKAASHHQQVIAINFMSLLYRKLLWNFLSSPRGKRKMNMRIRLMMTSVPLLINFPSLHIMV